MRSRREQEIDHLYRRAGFGASQQEVDAYTNLSFASYTAGVARLLNYADIPDDVDSFIGRPGYVGVTGRSGNGFQPATNILDARQRWLFRMVHSKRPLQEKMALFWHNHFATAYTKVNGEIGDSAIATRMFSAKPDEDGSRTRGQIELFRQYALGNFRDLLIEVAKDPAMLVWLDGRTNVRARPQENFARELMELFTIGVGHFEETDVYAGARVFTGWNLTLVEPEHRAGPIRLSVQRGQHDTAAKEFTFPIYADGRRTIQARSAAEGMQDGIDLINAVAAHPQTGPRLARKLYAFFVNEVDAPDQGLIDALARIVLRQELRDRADGSIAAPFAAVQRSVELLQALLLASRIRRAIDEGSWLERVLGEQHARPAINMGQQLFEPPDVNGWELGPGWFSSGGMLARMNFAARWRATNGSTCATSRAAKSIRPRACSRSCSTG